MENLSQFSYADIKNMYENDDDTKYSFVIEKYKYYVIENLSEEALSKPNVVLTKDITTDMILHDIPIESTKIISKDVNNGFVVVRFITKPVTLKFIIDVIFEYLYGIVMSPKDFYDNYAKDLYIK